MGAAQVGYRTIHKPELGVKRVETWIASLTFMRDLGDLTSEQRFLDSVQSSQTKALPDPHSLSLKERSC